MKAIILGAGFGTRLKPLTDKTAKPLIKIAGRPIIDYIIDKVLTVPNIEEIIIVCNQKFHGDFEIWSHSRNCPVSLKILNDGTTSNEDRKGAIGDSLFAIKQFSILDDILIIGGDNLFTFDLRLLFDEFLKKGNTIALYDIRNLGLAKLYGVVKINQSGKIIEMIEKPSEPQTTLISVCLYMYSRSVCKRFEEYSSSGKNMDQIGNFAAWLCKLEPVYGVSLEGAWFDIGDFKSLENANAFYEKYNKG
jgi:glucose-1-phosphate thymidylyltransferase